MDFFAFDDDYVRRLREGDRWTEKHYFKYFQLFLTLQLRKRRIQAGDIDDLIQEVHSRVFKELRSGKGVRDGHRFGSYVNSICNHVVQEHWRQDRHMQELEDIFASEDNALRDLITREKKERVRRTLREFEKDEPPAAAILRDLYFRQLSKEAICARRGVDRDYLRVLVHRALKKFREKYGDPDDS